MTAAVYRHYAPDGALLYIGSTVDLQDRESYHSIYSPWFVPGVRIEAVICGSLPIAREVEREAIKAEFPRWNITGRARNHPDGPAASHWHVGQKFPGTYREHLTWKPWRRGMRGEPFQHYRSYVAEEIQRRRLAREAWAAA